MAQLNNPYLAQKPTEWINFVYALRLLCCNYWPNEKAGPIVMTKWEWDWVKRGLNEKEE